MFARQIEGAISHAQSPNQLDQIARDLWRAHGAGALSDDEAQAFAEALQSRRARGVSDIGGTWKNAQASFPRASRQRSPDKNRSIERRRRLARASPVPPDLIDQFTQGEHAVITVVAGEIQRAGACTWCLDKIAAVAGVCKTLVREAIRKARNVGLLYSTERRRRGQKSLTNVVRVLRRSWGAWLKRIGCRKIESTTNKDSKIGRAAAVDSFMQGVGRMEIAKPVPRHSERGRPRG